MAIFSLAPDVARRCTANVSYRLFVRAGSTSMFAQSTYGSILGTVHDASGAAIEGAQVTLTNEGTAAMRTESTDAGGNYAFRNIDVGVYKVAISAQGFQPQMMSAISD